MPAFPRAEIQEMVDRFDRAMRKAEKTHDWTELGSFYTEDARYGWFLGYDEEVMLVGREAIANNVMGTEMDGFEGWTFEYIRSIIDEEQAEVVSFSPYVTGKFRKDGSPYQISGFTGSWFHYAGNFQWSWQRDFVDVTNLRAGMGEMLNDGVLGDGIRKLREARAADPEAGFKLPGHYRAGKSPIPIWELAPLPKPSA
jgi:hypothetical protein